MKIKLNCQMTNGTTTHRPGDVVDLDEAQAMSLIGEGMAEPIITTKPGATAAPEVPQKLKAKTPKKGSKAKGEPEADLEDNTGATSEDDTGAASEDNLEDDTGDDLGGNPENPFLDPDAMVE